jgi:hypothetical protein
MVLLHAQNKLKTHQLISQLRQNILLHYINLKDLGWTCYELEPAGYKQREIKTQYEFSASCMLDVKWEIFTVVLITVGGKSPAMGTDHGILTWSAHEISEPHGSSACGENPPGKRSAIRFGWPRRSVGSVREPAEQEGEGAQLVSGSGSYRFREKFDYFWFLFITFFVFYLLFINLFLN